jgi:outer membrane receptor for ferric coprogen and ferric-rhodotorulic acid
MHGGNIAAPAEPTYGALVLQEQLKTDTTRAYGAIHLNFTDKLTGIIGFNAVSLKGSGISYGVDQSRSESKVSPYFGAVYDINTNVSLYASYADIFNPQSESDVNHQKLDAAQGKNIEAGIKSEWFDKRLYATAAYFKSEQYGLAEWAGYYEGTFNSYYTGLDTFVEGYELEVAGKITPQWTVNGGWTSLSVEGSDGNDVRTYLPRDTLKLSSTYSLPQYRDLKLGAAVRWQGEVSTSSAGYPFSQEAYSVVDLMGSVRVTDRIRASLNIKNALDEKYFGGLQWDQAFYAAPRSVMVTLDWTY